MFHFIKSSIFQTIQLHCNMNIQEIKTIKLQDFLASLGHTPVKQQGNKLWYLSPFRTERQASFKVNTELNQWYDFGIGKGGNIIALAEELYKSSDVSYLIRLIERNVPSCVHPLSIPYSKKESPQHAQSFENLKDLPLAHPALTRYLHERCIDMEVATAVCVKNSITTLMVSTISELVSPIVQVGMKYATRSSKAVSLQRILVFSMLMSRRRFVTFSRALWTSYLL